MLLIPAFLSNKMECYLMELNIEISTHWNDILNHLGTLCSGEALPIREVFLRQNAVSCDGELALCVRDQSSSFQYFHIILCFWGLPYLENKDITFLVFLWKYLYVKNVSWLGQPGRQEKPFFFVDEKHSV